MTKTERRKIEGVIETLEVCANYDDLMLKNRSTLIMNCAKILCEVIALPQVTEE